MAAIPQWPSSCVDASDTYNGCQYLTDIWDEEATVAEIMPSTITSHENAVKGTGATLRAYFTSDWGGTKTS